MSHLMLVWVELVVVIKIILLASLLHLVTFLQSDPMFQFVRDLTDVPH